MSCITALRIALLATVAALAAAVPASAALTPATPIRSTGDAPTLPARSGAVAKARPVPGVLPAWQNPFMAADPKNSVHNDSWQTDDYNQFAGPLGRNPRTFSTEIGRTCITLTFDRKGRLIGSCTNLGDGPGLYMLDPDTLDTLAFLQLPFVPPPAGTNPALNTTGGAYFFLDDKDRVVVAAANRHLLVVGETTVAGAPAFRVVADHDPTSCLPAGERMPSTLPDAQGRLWFVGRYHGAVGVLDPRTGTCGSIVLDEEIENSFAVAKDGVYIVTDKAQYKFRAGADLKPKVVWRAAYRNSGIAKPGQINAGSGTTPTLLHGPRDTRRTTSPTYVAITDNADPMNVVVYRAADRLPKGARRVVCQIPVFGKGASDTENSLIAMGSSLIVENNYGYDLQKFNDVLPGATLVQLGGDPGLVSTPGMARIDINAKGTGCRKVWTNTTVRPASVVSKGNTRTGLIYTYENVRDPGAPKADPWYWTAVDYRTGKVVWTQFAGHGGLWNNHYAGIGMGRSKAGRPTLYLGGVGGIMALRDGS